MATFTPNRIVLISRGRHEEGHALADIYPGMLLIKDSSLNIIPHNIVGGAGVIMVAKEDALRGLTINQKSGVSGSDGVPYQIAAKGDMLLMLLKAGQIVTKNGALMSAGDGTLTLDPTALNKVLYQIVAPSTNVTNLNTETTFSNGSFTIPANTLQVGDVLHIRGRAVVSGQNSTNTHRVRVFIGTTALADSTALAMAAADYMEWDLYLTVRSLGSSGAFVLSGYMTTTVAGTPTVAPVVLGTTAVDTTAVQTIKVTTLASATSTGNIIALQEYQADIQGAGSSATLFLAQEDKDNTGSTGSSDFNTAMPVRVLVA